MRLSKLAVVILLLGTGSVGGQAQEISEDEQCLLNAIKEAGGQTTVKEIRAKCDMQDSLPVQVIEPEEVVSHQQDVELPVDITHKGALAKRIINERRNEFNPFVLTPHRMNYILPFYTTNSINKAAYTNATETAEHFEDIEAKFQVSLKVPLTSGTLFFPGDAVHFGFTVESWWQVYADNISKPFRETNYRPEVMYMMPTKWHPLGSNTGLVFGLEHQSNGRSNDLSRSWNRFYTTLLLEKENFALAFQPWWRLPEREKRDINDVLGDDNPDIDDYMGHFEVNAAHKWDEYQVNLMLRQNFQTSNGAVQLGFTFPLWERFRGYAVVFNGYGDSLIDYNHKQTRIGLGFALTDFL